METKNEWVENWGGGPAAILAGFISQMNFSPPTPALSGIGSFQVSVPKLATSWTLLLGRKDGMPTPGLGFSGGFREDPGIMGFREGKIQCYVVTFKATVYSRRSEMHV